MTTLEHQPHTAAPPRAAGNLESLLAAQKAAFRAEGPVGIEVRRDRLRRLQSALAGHAGQLATAISEDFGSRPHALSLGGDVAYTIGEIAELRAFLPRWVKTESPRRWLRLIGVKEEIRHDPLGVVGVAGPWNFPIQLCVAPAAGAIAAGNRVMIRPSSMTRRTGDVLAEAISKYFDPAEVAVVTANYGPGSAFSKLAFDSFFFTGSPEVGREVARDCAANLVPVSLELGGKNPVVVDRDADITRMARRIAAAKMLNSGQVCLSLDYAFVPRQRVPAFVAEVLATWTKMFPAIQDNPDYTSIINDTNFDRIVGHIEDARAKGATVHQVIPPRENLPDRRSRKMPPTVLTGLTPGMTIETDEIFGPVLSVYDYDDIEEAIGFIGDRDSPLALYWYGPDNERKQSLIDRTRSGAICANEFMPHMAPGGGMPFGGVGTSGYGYYHGKYSIDTFTHARAHVTYSGRVGFSGFMRPSYMSKTTGLSAALLRRLQ
ncbi:aldehyde dehydrogenase family protein [Mycobacteroides abscessus]|nr:aldehyde dehydrogenase family protein [Mycobacteroides abscessus]MDM1890234.1 aldehyde dehydrogenase family protein [Mycobacteroides abscessus]